MLTEHLRGYRADELREHEGEEVQTWGGTLKRYTVEGRADGKVYTDVEMDNGICGGFQYTAAAAAEPEPTPGMEIQWIGRGFGFAHRGVIIGDFVHWYETMEEHVAKNAEADRERRAKQEAVLADERESYVARTAALPEPLRSRVDVLRERSKGTAHEWDRDYWAYELFTLEEAAKFVAHARETGKAELTDDPKDDPPTLSDQHSGNTYGAAKVLAQIILTSSEEQAREYTHKMHGALAPLVGSDATG